jgi:hypothetical protein
MAATFEVTVRLPGLGERNVRSITGCRRLHLDSTVHGFEIDATDAARAPHQDFPQLGQGVTPTERIALIDSSSSFGAFGADAEGVRCSRSGGA